MKHIEEHVLELLVLGEPSAVKLEKEIRAHLDECLGCRAIYSEIHAYYDDVKREYAKSNEPHKSTASAIVPRKREVEPYLEPVHTSDVVLSEVTVPTIWRRVGNFTRSHPAVSFFFGVMLITLLVIGVRSFIKVSENPSYFYYNTKTNDVDIYSSDDKLLWSIPAYDAAIYKYNDASLDLHQTILADLNGDGKNEVITTAQPRNGQKPSHMRMYDWKGNLLQSFIFKVRNVTFRGEHYYSPFEPDKLLSIRMPDGINNLFVYATGGRSPSFLARLDYNLNVIGKYWHYGNFTPFSIDVKHHGTQEIAITGTDDLHDMSGGKFNFLAILDPSKIIGDKECLETPGFGFEPSEAELYYIRFPKSDIETSQAVGGRSYVMRQTGDSLIHVKVQSVPDDALSGSWGFEFLFYEGDMSVRDVKFASPTPETFETLKKEGKVRGVFGMHYLQALKKGVEYWNGARWVHVPTMIQRGPFAAN
ncbi:MAG TPA: hypothetical protein VIS48_05930 [Candidatus Kryptonia bacterium]